MERIGSYEVSELESTATSTLYEAVHVLLPRCAVIKVAPTQVILRPALAIQLLREACLMEALRHPGVPEVFESGILPDGRPWFAREQVIGMTLATQLVGGAMASYSVATLIRDLAEILEHAHRRGVTHRGLRPDRILVAGDRVVIADWSDARTHDAAPSIRHVPTPVTRHYQAPELARGDAIDDRADIYALGVIAYQALTGVVPRALPSDPHIPALERRPDAPRELAQLVDQMLAGDRFDRPSSAEIRSDLDWLAGVLPQTPPVPMPIARIRRPRWTPPIVSDHLPVVAGEILRAFGKR
jgi:serine/threonine protein kinase